MIISNGMVLDPGSYFVELSLTHPAKDLEGLSRSIGLMGFSPSLYDRNSKELSRLCFFGILRAPVMLRSHPSSIQWLFVQRCYSDLFQSLTCQLHPHELITSATYELSFLVRRRSAPKDEIVLQLLENMGWEKTSPLLVIGRDIHLPGKPNTDFIHYFVIAKWTKPPSHIVAEDPFYFEHVLCLDGVSSYQQDDQSEEKQDEPEALDSNLSSLSTHSSLSNSSASASDISNQPIATSTEAAEPV